ncbi:DUF3541 domain-containing protein [Halomonas sp. TRM85114]|uniref:DUF3541 domain-containing protein n=1 Tax=Halomonas jincaotanensis TaxID=2810616 RepID=UPI001BD60E18|nr:DUF3541 domain-containing protein [Halomonas jincaotanensis]MBS9403617.1 DUF3541 domain-containing protein [Halomonas jincaotanensis]
MAWLCLLLWLTGCASIAPDIERERHRQAGLDIQAVYEAALPTLPQDKQRHYAQRLYRLTGEARYLDINRAYGHRLVGRLAPDIQGLADSLDDNNRYAEARSQEIVAAYPQRTAKQRARRAMLAEWGEIAFAAKLLFRLVQADYHGLLPALDNHEVALDYLADVDWRPFLTDPAVLGIYAAQAANQVHYLHQLGIVDLRAEVEAAFRQRYPPSEVGRLDDTEYRNWLYGLTHFAIAASRYYQQHLDTRDIDWVLNAFESEAVGILTRATEDIQAEVAMSFLLAGQEQHPLVREIRDALVNAVDPVAGIIPSPSGSLDLAGGEHRNVLAIMVLRWPGRLFSGPDMSSTGS